MKLGAPQAVRCGGLEREQYRLLAQERRAGVLHAAVGELRHEHQIVLRKREREAEVLREEVDRLAVQAECLVRLALCACEPRLAHQEACLGLGRDALLALVEDRERSGGEGEEVGADRLGCAEAHALRRAVGDRLGGRGVRDRFPAGGDRERQREPALQVGLIEAREDRARVGGHEERVHVLGAVLAVAVEGHGGAGGGDRRCEAQPHRVLPGAHVPRRDDQVLAHDARLLDRRRRSPRRATAGRRAAGASRARGRPVCRARRPGSRAPLRGSRPAPRSRRSARSERRRSAPPASAQARAKRPARARARARRPPQP